MFGSRRNQDDQLDPRPLRAEMATPSSAIQLDGWDFARVSVTRSWTYGFLSDGNDARGWTPRNLCGEACDGAGHPIICAGGAARDSIARPTPEFPRKKNGPQVPIRDICWDLGQWRMASRGRAPQDKDEPNASRISANKRAAPFVPDCPLAFEQRRPIMGLERRRSPKPPMRSPRHSSMPTPHPASETPTSARPAEPSSSRTRPRLSPSAPTAATPSSARRSSPAASRPTS